jgi:type IV secretory pathway TrbL component
MNNSKERSQTRAKSALERRIAIEHAAALARHKTTMRSVAKNAAALGNALTKARTRKNLSKVETAAKWKKAEETLRRTAAEVQTMKKGTKNIENMYINGMLKLVVEIENHVKKCVEKYTGHK